MLFFDRAFLKTGRWFCCVCGNYSHFFLLDGARMASLRDVDGWGGNWGFRKGVPTGQSDRFAFYIRGQGLLTVPTGQKKQHVQLFGVRLIDEPLGAILSHNHVPIPVGTIFKLP